MGKGGKFGKGYIVFGGSRGGSFCGGLQGIFFLTFLKVTQKILGIMGLKKEKSHGMVTL